MILSGDGANTIVISEFTGSLEEMINTSKQNNQGFYHGNNQSVYLLFAKLYPVFNFLTF